MADSEDEAPQLPVVPPSAGGGREQGESGEDRLDAFASAVLARVPDIPANPDWEPSPSDVLLATWVRKQSIKQVKPITLKKLSASPTGSKEDVSFMLRKDAALMDIGDAGAMVVLEKPRDDVSNKDWYDQTSSTVFNALFRSVFHIPTLAHKVRSLRGTPDCAKAAWEALDKFFVKKTEWAEIELRRELANFKHKAGEDMSSFLSRMDDLREKAAAYDMPFTDAECVLPVMLSLERAWGKDVSAAFPPGTRYSAMDWDTVRNTLESEDQQRRGCAKGSTLLPLGWTSRHGGARVSTGEPNPPAVRPAPSFHPSGGSRLPGPQGPNNRKKPTRWQDLLCCWFCKRIGHSIRDCRNKGKPPFYTATPHDREVCDKKKQEHFATLQSRAGRAHAVSGASPDASTDSHVAIAPPVVSPPALLPNPIL